MILRVSTKRELIFTLLTIFFLSVFVVFFQFNVIPKNLTFDEIEFSKLALSLDGKAYTPYSPYATGHSTLYFYILLLSLKLFGISSLALRLPSAIFGILTPLLLFFILRKSIRKTIAFPSPLIQEILPIAGTFLFITARWYFNFARFGFEATFLLFLELMSLYFVLKYSDHHQKKWLIYCAIFSGLSYNSYQPGRFFFIIPLIFIFLTILERKQHRLDFSFFTKQTIRTFLSFVIPFLIIILPLSLYLSSHQDIRMNQLFYPANTEMTLGEKGQFFLRNVISTGAMFSIKGDVNGRHNYPNKPALNPIVSFLFVFGLILCLKGIKKKTNQLFLIYFLISIGPTLLTYPWENPNMLRTVTAIPSVMYFSTLSLGSLFHFAERILKIRYTILLFILFGIISASAIYDLRTYFLYQSVVFNQAFEATQPLQYYINHPNAKIK